MDVVFIKNAQHDINGNQRRQDQVRLRGERRLEYLRCALKTRMNRSGHDHRAHCVLNRYDRLSECDIRRKIKSKGDRGRLALVRNGKRSHRSFVMREGAERNLLAGGGLHIDIPERVGSLLEGLSHLHHHVILVCSLVHGGDLPLAKGVVQSVIDDPRIEAEAAGRIAINDQAGSQRAVLQIAIYVLNLRNGS